jgi:hypothetical protein
MTNRKLKYVVSWKRLDGGAWNSYWKSFPRSGKKCAHEFVKELKESPEIYKDVEICLM